MARPNHRLVKIHRTYTVDEAATRLGVHRNTIRDWVKRGLQTCDGKRPMLILGRDLASFLVARRSKAKRPCRPGEIYCVRCRQPRAPRNAEVTYRATTPNLGNLVGICSTCDSAIFRRVNPWALWRIIGALTITPPEGPRDIGESYRLSVNSDLKRGGAIHGHAQSE
jgi:hypothetical protein